MAKHLNLAHTVCYLNSMPVSHLDGVWNAVQAKMAELGLVENRRSLRRLPEIEYAESPSGNLGGVTEWVRDLSPPVELTSADVATKTRATEEWTEQTDKLVMLQAVISERFSQARYKPKTPRIED